MALTAAAIQPVHAHSLTPICEYTFSAAEDLDYDDAPDNWTRRKGPQFPHYVSAGIDRTAGVDDGRSLRMEANGAGAIYYSPLIPIDDLHTYFFSGYLRSEGLKHDAAMLSISLVDFRRQRVQRFLSRPVVGDHEGWVPIQLGPITPRQDVRFAVIGCHLVLGSSDTHDIGGRVWFDKLSLGRLPRMELESDLPRHFVRNDSPLEIGCRVSGLDPGHSYEMELEFQDSAGKLLHHTRELLEEDPETKDRRLTDFMEPRPVKWKLQSQRPGYYSVTAMLLRNGSPIASQATSLVVLARLSAPRSEGEFGWSLTDPLEPREQAELPQISSQAGINWLKYPLWQTSEDTQPQAAADIALMLDRLVTAHITPIGLLAQPPIRIRSQFARNWQGIREVFSMPQPFWRASLEPVIARYSSLVRDWQLGGEDDSSFAGAVSTPSTVKLLRQEIQKISLSAAVGVPWTWGAGIPDPEAQFNSFSSPAPQTPRELEAALQTLSPTTAERWVVLKLAHVQGTTAEERAASLARMIITAKAASIPRIFVNDVYHDQHGLLNTDGSPRALFIPWRTMALSLQGAEYVGSLAFPNGSPNAVFARDGVATVVIWNDVPTQESLFLGVSPATRDLWGNTQPLAVDATTGESQIQVGPVPQLLIGCSEAIARLRIAARYETGRMKSEYGGHHDALLLKNTFGQGVSGQLTLELPPEWEAEPRSWTIDSEAGEELRLPTFLRLPPNAHLGSQMTIWDIDLMADRPYRFRLFMPYTVGLDEIEITVIDRKLPDGRLEIEQLVTNRTDPVEKLNFRCSLFVPDNRRQRVQITKLGAGSDRKFYHLPDADHFRGQELRLRLEQEGGRRILNYKWIVGKEWLAGDAEAVEKLSTP